MANVATIPKAPLKRKPLRKDPPIRYVTDAERWLTLDNPDERLHYVWVNKNGGIGADPSFYRARGYHVVKFQAGGVAPAGRSEEYVEGQPMEFMDCVLMACTVEAREQAEAEGQSAVDVIESQIVDRKRSPKDLLRGIRGGFYDRHGRVENETEDLFAE